MGSQRSELDKPYNAVTPVPGLVINAMSEQSHTEKIGILCALSILFPSSPVV